MEKKFTNKIFILIIIVVLSLSSYVNYKVFVSYNEQNFLLNEFNTYQFNIPLEIVNSFNDEFPNITVTTLPLKMLKARYFIKEDTLEDLAISFLHESKKANPYLKIADFELSKYHYKKNNIDSAEFYAKSTFEALPRNYLHSRLYFQILANQKKEAKLDSAFYRIKNNYIIDQWRDYLFSKIKIGITPNDELRKVLNEAQKAIPNQAELNTLNTIINVGFDKLDDLGKLIIEAETYYKQDDFIEAANLFEQAARMDNNEYTHYQNAALSFYRGNNYEQAENLFRYVLSNFDVTNGKAEFYLGLLLYEKGDQENACKFWNISLLKRFPGSQNVLETFCD